MIRYLTSDFGNYEKKDGQKITHPIDNINGIVDQFKNDIKKFDKVVFVSYHTPYFNAGLLSVLAGFLARSSAVL